MQGALSKDGAAWAIPCFLAIVQKKVCHAGSCLSKIQEDAGGAERQPASRTGRTVSPGDAACNGRQAAGIEQVDFDPFERAGSTIRTCAYPNGHGLTARWLSDTLADGNGRRLRLDRTPKGRV